MDLSKHKITKIFVIGITHCDINVDLRLFLIAMILFPNEHSHVPHEEDFDLYHYTLTSAACCNNSLTTATCPF